MQTKNSQKKQPNPLLKGLPLISYFSGLRKNDKASCSEFSLSVPKLGTLRSYLYYPYKKDPSKLPGIFLPHGMNVLGIDDIRLVNLAKNLALCGYSVLTPEFPEIKQLLIQESMVEKFTLSFYEFYKNESLHQPERVSFFSVSFSGSIGLIAFSKPPINQMINSSMVIGACSHFSDTYLYANKNFSIDNYAGLILFLNYLPYIEKKIHLEISRALFEYAVDNGLKREGSDAIGPKEHKKLRPAASDFLHKILTNEEFRSSIVYGIKDNLPANLIKNLSPYYHLADYKAALSLLHGTTDPVIAPEESIKMYYLLKNRNHPVYLEISDLITHGDQVPLQNQIKSVPGVTRAFGFYFSYT